jgi:hypothetical protein
VRDIEQAYEDLRRRRGEGMYTPLRKMLRGRREAMGEERCEISDLPVSMCGHCRGTEAQEAPFGAESVDLGFGAAVESVTEYGPLFFAARYGPCSGCETGIVPDDTIRADGQGGYLHEDCELS